jgi:hypothetical protein
MAFNESLVVGGAAIVGAGLLLWREIALYPQRSKEDPWLFTGRRHSRRIFISLTLALLGLLIASSGTGFLPLEPRPDGTPRIANLMTFVLGGLNLSFLLIALALIDFRETSRAAARKILTDHRLNQEQARAGINPESDRYPILTTKSPSISDDDINRPTGA